MKKIIKYSLVTIVSLVVLVAVAVTLLVTVVNPNRFKPFIEKAVYQSTGRTITLAGDISWKLYPNLGVNVKQVSLSNPAGFSESNFVAVNSADVSVALIPLLSHHIVVKTLAIDGLNLALIQKNGLNNWTFTPPATPPMAPTATGGKPQPLQLEMSSFSLTNATVSYDNLDKNQRYTIQKANFTIDTGFGGVIRFDQGADMLKLAKVNFNYNDQVVGALNFTVNNLSHPQYSGDINLTKFQASAILNQFNVATAARKNITLLDNVIISGNVNGDESNIAVKDFAFNLSDKFKGKTSLTVKNFANPMYNGSIDLEPFNLNSILDSLNIAVAERKNKPLLNNFAISSSGFSGNMSNISLNGLKVTAGKEAPVSASFGKLQVQNFAKPQISGDITVPKFNLNGVLNGLNIAVAERKNKPLLNSFAFSAGGFKVSPTTATFSNIKLSAGELLNLAFGSLQVSNFNSPVVSGNVAMGDTNLNKVLDGLNIAAAERKNKPLLNSVAFSGGFSATPTSVALSSASFRCGSLLKGTTAVNVKNFAAPQLNGTINLPTFNLNETMRQLGMTPPELSNKQLLNSFAITTAFNGSTKNIALSQMVMKIANSTISGNVNVSSFTPLAFSENLNIDQMDVADFSNVNGYKVPLRQLKFNGNSSIAGNMDLATLSGHQNIQIGNISVLGISLDRLVMQLNNSINQAGGDTNNLGKLLMNSAQVVQTVNNMKAQVEAATKPGKRDFNQKTDLGSFSGSATITKGLVNPSNFKLSGPSVALSGNGAVDLAKKTINYHATGQLLTPGINPIFKKLTFPVTVSGSSKDPSASLDWGSIQTQILKYVVTNNKSQIQNAISQGINQAIGNNPNANGSNNNPQNKIVNDVSKGVTDAVSKLFGGD